jgi:hypothetical protein
MRAYALRAIFLGSISSVSYGVLFEKRAGHLHEELQLRFTHILVQGETEDFLPQCSRFRIESPDHPGMGVSPENERFYALFAKSGGQDFPARDPYRQIERAGTVLHDGKHIAVAFAG